MKHIIFILFLILAACEPEMEDCFYQVYVSGAAQGSDVALKVYDQTIEAEFIGLRWFYNDRLTHETLITLECSDENAWCQILINEGLSSVNYRTLERVEAKGSVTTKYRP